MCQDAPRLTPKQLKASILIASGIPLTKVAEQVGVTIASINQWRQEKPFSGYLLSLHRDQHQLARYLFFSDKLEVAEKLINELKHPNSDIRFKSAIEILGITTAPEE